MSMTMLTVIQIVQALAAYSFVMLFLPWVFLRKYLAHFELSERIIGYFLTGNFYIIYLVFLLQFLHISNWKCEETIRLLCGLERCFRFW